MTDFVYDRSFNTGGSSSAVDSAYYNSDSHQLIVQLDRRDWYGKPVRAGYDNVPADVYTAFELLNTSRLDGNDNASVGSYWNTWIKPYFSGFDTRDLEPVGAVVETKEPATEVTLESIEEASDDVATEVDVQAQPFLIHFEDDSDESNAIVVYATSVGNALVIFNQIADLAGWQDVQITASTQFFEN